MSSAVGAAPGFLERVRSVAQDVAARHADDVDRDARFPAEGIAALREEGALSALVPERLGGAGLGLEDVATACFELGRACSATAMVFAMHQIQVATIARHLEPGSWFEDYLAQLAAEQRLIASVTSEVGTGGDMGRSIAAIEPAGEGLARFEKRATTVSYGLHADDLLVTLRRGPATEESDQVAALALGGQFRLESVGAWDPLGMRGTCSPGCVVIAEIAPRQVIATPFARVSAETMTPVSHILWSHLWLGIATDAFHRARAFVRAAARANPGTTPPAAQRLSALMGELSLLRGEVHAGLRDFVEADADDDRRRLNTMAAALRFNNLKIASSEQAPRVCQTALLVTGMAGFQNGTPYSVGRHLRDSLSAALMVANDRIRATNAGLLLIAKDV